MTHMLNYLLSLLLMGPSGHQATYSIIIQEISQEEVETTTSDANKVSHARASMQSGQSHAYSDSSYNGRPSRREHSVYYLINRIADAFRLLP